MANFFNRYLAQAEIVGPAALRGCPSFVGQFATALTRATRTASRSPDHQTFPCSLDDSRSDRLQLVDAKNAFDLRQQPSEQAEIAAGNADDGGDGILVGYVRGRRRQTDLRRVLGQ